MALSLVATLVAIWLRVATALSEIVIGTVAQLVIGAALGSALLAADASWLKFLAGAGAILLTFLAGAELDPAVFRRQWKQAEIRRPPPRSTPSQRSSPPERHSAARDLTVLPILPTCILAPPQVA